MDLKEETPEVGSLRIKHRCLKRYILVLMGTVLLFSTLFSVYGAEKNDYEKLINQTKNQLKRVIRKEKSALNSLVTTQKELNQVEGRLNRIENELNSTHNKLLKLEDAIAQTKERLAALERSRDTYRNQLNSRIVALYKYGFASHLEVLLQAENFSDFVNRFELVGYFVRHDLDVIDSLEEKCKKIAAEHEFLANRHNDIAREKDRIGRLKKEHVVAKEKLANKVEQREEELTRIQSDRRELEKALDELERTSRDMEEKIRDYQSRGTPSLGSGRLVWPLQGRITSPFGWRRHPVLRKQKYHTGIDIAVGYNTPVAATDNGVVMYSGWNGGYGKMISIDHGNHISTLYAHCNQLKVSVGERVTQGQIIALSGSTGLSTGPHLHFEVRVNGTPANPMNYLP